MGSLFEFKKTYAKSYTQKRCRLSPAIILHEINTPPWGFLSFAKLKNFRQLKSEDKLDLQMTSELKSEL